MLNKKPRVLAITLARGGSKSVPKKNIRKINGFPLIAYTIMEALKSKYITRYIVSTDDKEIKKVSEKYGAEVPFLRPKNLASDKASSVSALQHAVQWIEKNEGEKYDYIIELMCTNPLKNYIDIDACIKKLIKTNADSVIAVHQLEDHHPARIKKIINDKIVDFCVVEKNESRRQDLKPKAYVRSGSIYALKRNHLMLENKRYGSVNSRPFILPSEKAINIDTEADLIIAKYKLNND
jgi:CMP-N-acetylneuraminic acid synthetase